MKLINKTKLIVLIAVISTGMLLSSCSSGLKVPDLYKYDDFSEFIKLGNYQGLEYEVINPEVTDDDIQEYVDKVRDERKTTKQVKSGIVQSDSVVNIAYVGTVDGKEFEGGSAESMDVDIANSTFIEGFAEGLVGKSVGETFDLNVTFPSDYGESSLAGKPAVFKTTINYIEEAILPDYNDEFVQKVSEYKTVDEYEEYVSGILLENKKLEAKSNERASVFEQIVQSSELIKCPDKELKHANNDENQVKTELVLHSIAKLEGIEITDKDYNDFINKLLEDAGITAEEFEQSGGMTIGEYAEQNNLFSSMLYEMVMDKVMEYSTSK